MIHQYKLLLLSIFLLINKSYSQNVMQSKTFVETCYNKTDCFMISNSGQLFVNSLTGEFIVQVDFNKFKIGNDTLDDWLNDLSKTYLIFKAQLSPVDVNIMVGNTNQSSMPSIVPGTITFNGITKPYKLEIHYSGSYEERIPNSELNYPARATISTQIAFHAKDFNIGNRKHHYTKTIRKSIARGYVNEWIPEIDNFIKN